MENITHVQTQPRVQRFSFSSFGDGEKKRDEPTQLAQPPVAEETNRFFEPPVIPQNVITEEELQNAKKDGYEQGYKEGFTACEAKVEKEKAKLEEDIKSVLETIANRLTIAAEEHSSYISCQFEITKTLALAVARKVAGDAIKYEPYESVEAVLRECLALIVGESRVIISVSSSIAPGLKQRIDSLRPLLPGFDGELIVEESDSLNENDCRVEWKGGYAGRDTARLWNDIENIIARTAMNKHL